MKRSALHIKDDVCIPNTPILYIALIGLYYYLYIADKRIIILSV